MIRLRRTAPALLLTAAVGLGGHAALSSAAGSRTINVKDHFYSPKNVTIKKGTLVTFRWASANDSSHDVTSRGTRRFKSSEIETTGTHRVRFKKTGTYRYFCTLHEDHGMTGKIKVVR